MKRIFWPLILILPLLSLSARGQEDLPAELENLRQDMGVPGLAVGQIGSEGLEFEGYYGMMDSDSEVDEDTLFMIASVSKLVITTALMQQWEEGRFELEDDVSDYLGFPVRNPRYPDEPITFLHLATHRSSITDFYPLYDDLYTIEEGGGDFPQDLGPFLKDYLVPGGAYYSEDNFTRHKPGKKFEYSNYGASLLAVLVEQLSGEKFPDYCRNHIFDPLGMDQSWFMLRNIPEGTPLASPRYEQEWLPHYSFPDYPAGSLMTNVRDMSRFISFYLGQEADEPDILDRDTIELMWGTYGQSADLGEGQMGIIWVHWSPLVMGGIGHSGGDYGVSSFLSLYPEEGRGTIVMMNGNPSRYVYLRKILKLLKE